MNKCQKCRKCKGCRKCDNYNECPICLDYVSYDYIVKKDILNRKNYNGVLQLNKCKHIFHYNCLIEWFKRESTCPLCRLKIIDAYNVYIYDSKKLFFSKTRCVVNLLEHKISFYHIKKYKKNNEYNLIENPENEMINNNSFIILKEREYLTHEFNHILYQYINLIKIHKNSIVIRYITGPDLINHFYSFYNNNDIELLIIFNNLKKRLTYYKMINS